MLDGSGAAGISLVFREIAGGTVPASAGALRVRFRRHISLRGDISGV
ncbi:hypothetical protein [Halorubrum coriense]|nr:hypothetical protein [Halorubrum coriense]